MNLYACILMTIVGATVSQRSPAVIETQDSCRNVVYHVQSLSQVRRTGCYYRFMFI